MNWLLPAILAPIIFTVVNFVDKFIVERAVRNYWAMPVFSGLVALVMGTILWVITGFPILPLKEAVVVIFTGMLTAFGAALYFKALSLEEASKIIVFIQVQPVIVLVLSLVFLNEIITGEHLVGFVLILGAAVAISLTQQSGGFRLSAAFFLIIAVDLIWASSIVIFKAVVTETAFADVLSYESWGLALGSAVLYLGVPAIRRGFHESVKDIPRYALGAIMVNESVFLVAKLMTFLAVSLGPVALVSVLGSTQVFFGIVAGWVMTTIAPAVFKEDVSWQILLKKGTLALVMFGGIWLINSVG